MPHPLACFEVECFCGPPFGKLETTIIFENYSEKISTQFELTAIKITIQG
jgi:hypothetical protein